MYFIGLESDCQVKIFFMDRCSAKTLEADCGFSPVFVLFGPF